MRHQDDSPKVVAWMLEHDYPHVMPVSIVHRESQSVSSGFVAAGDVSRNNYWESSLII